MSPEMGGKLLKNIQVFELEMLRSIWNFTEIQKIDWITNDSYDRTNFYTKSLVQTFEYFWMMFYLFCSFNFYHTDPLIVRDVATSILLWFFPIAAVRFFKYFTYNPSELRTTYSHLITSKSTKFEDSFFWERLSEVLTRAYGN